MAEVTMYDYIAISPGASRKAWDILQKNGYKNRPKDWQGLAKAIKYYVHKTGEQAVDEMANIHPDKALILEVCAPKAEPKKETEKPKEETKSFCGCGVDGESFNCSGCTPKAGQTLSVDAATATTSKGLTEAQTNILILAGVAFVGLAIVMGLKQNK